MKSCLYYRSSKVFIKQKAWKHGTILSMSLMFFFAFSACKSTKKPPHKIKLPLILQEVSGLSIDRENNLYYIHNDSGDKPNLYAFDPATENTKTIRIPALASDWEDMTTDNAGNFYLADVGNNRGLRKQMAIYRYAPTTAKTDSIIFTYPKQDGSGRSNPGNYNCEAMVYTEDETLHLFTKAMAGVRKAYWSYHFTVPADPGRYEATLVDSLYLPRRVITAAALDPVKKELVLTAYNYKRVFGFFPAVASSFITCYDYPDNRFFQGKMKRKNLSWAVPTQYEAIDFYDDRYIYVGTERTKMTKQSLKRIRRRKTH